MSEFALNPEVESLDGIPEKYHALYEENEGKFVLDSVIATKLRSDAALKRALDEERRKKKIDPETATFAEKWAALKDLGMEPEEIAEAIAKQSKKPDPDPEAFKRTLEEKINKATTPLKHELEAAEAELRRSLIDSAAATAIANAKGSAKLLMPHIKDRARVEKEDGKYIVRVYTPDGKSVLYNDDGEPASIEYLVAQLKEDQEFGVAFAASGATGGGTPPSGKSAGSGSFDPRKASTKQKSEFIAKHGFQKWTEALNAGRAEA